MSNFSGKAMNPNTGMVESASFLDNYYESGGYVVMFSDGGSYPIEAVVTLKVVSEDEGVYWLFLGDVKGSLTHQPDSAGYQGRLEAGGHSYGGKDLHDACRSFKKAVHSAFVKGENNGA